MVFGKVGEWCDICRMKLNSTKTMIVSRSRTMHLQSLPSIGRIVLMESDAIDVLGATFDAKITFEKNLCSVSTEASQRIGILNKSC